MDNETAIRIYERLLNGIQKRIDTHDLLMTNHSAIMKELLEIRTGLLQEINETCPSVDEAVEAATPNSDIE